MEVAITTVILLMFSVLTSKYGTDCNAGELQQLPKIYENEMFHDVATNRESGKRIVRRTSLQRERNLLS